MTGGCDRNTMVDPTRVRLSRIPPWAVHATIDDRAYPGVQIVRAAPLSDPDHYIGILDEQGEGICVIRDPAELDGASRQIVEEELRQRYLSAMVQRIHSVRQESGSTYFEVETNRGRSAFIVKDGTEGIRRFGPRFVLVDVDGNRFEILDVNALDRRSARLVSSVF